MASGKAAHHIRGDSAAAALPAGRPHETLPLLSALDFRTPALDATFSICRITKGCYAGQVCSCWVNVAAKRSLGLDLLQILILMQTDISVIDAAVISRQDLGKPLPHVLS